MVRIEVTPVDSQMMALAHQLLCDSAPDVETLVQAWSHIGPGLDRRLKAFRRAELRAENPRTKRRRLAAVVASIRHQKVKQWANAAVAGKVREWSELR